MTLYSGVKSDVGKVRKNNEDSFTFNTELGLYIVADGIGWAQCW